MNITSLRKIMEEDSKNMKRETRPRKSDQENQYDNIKIKVKDMEEVKGIQKQIQALGYQASSLTDMLESMKKPYYAGDTGRYWGGQFAGSCYRYRQYHDNEHLGAWPVYKAGRALLLFIYTIPMCNCSNRSTRSVPVRYCNCNKL